MSADIDEYWAGKRNVFAVVYSLAGGFDGAFTMVDGNRLDQLFIFLKIGVTKKAQGIQISHNPFDQNIVVFTLDEIGTTSSLLAVDYLGEIVESSTVGAWPVKLDGTGRPAWMDILPGYHLAVLVPDFFQFSGSEGAGPSVLLVNHNGDTIVGHRNFQVTYLVFLCLFNLSLFDVTGSVVDMGLPGGKFFKSPSGSRNPYIDANFGIKRSKFFRYGLCYGINRAGTVD